MAAYCATALLLHLSEVGASFTAAHALVQTLLLATARKGELTSRKAAGVHLMSHVVVTRCVGF